MTLPTLTDDRGRALWCTGCDRYPATVRVSADCALCTMCAETAVGQVLLEREAPRA